MRTFRHLGASALLALSLAACSDGSGPNGTARVSVMLTDAPGDVVNAWVAISEIYLQGGAEGRVTLAEFDPSEVVELTALSNTTTELVNSVEIEAGTYNELRMVLVGGCLEVEDAGGNRFFASDAALCPEGAEVTGNLIMPSLGQSGLKVSFDGDLVFAGGDTPLLLDFDVAQSFGHQAGQSGNWVMTPVIRGGVMAEAGTVTVTLTKASGVCGLVNLVDFKAELIADGGEAGEVRAFTDADANGTFEATYNYTLPGDYTVELVLPVGLASVTTSVTLPAPVTVTAGGNATVNLTLNACS